MRKFRTLTELILDAQEHVKNPYKGKKLKVSFQEKEHKGLERQGPKNGQCLTLTMSLFLLPETPGLPKEAPDPLFPLFHGEAGQVRKTPPRDEQPGPDQDSVQEIQRAAGEEEGGGRGTKVRGGKRPGAAGMV